MCDKYVEECDLHWQQGYAAEDCRVQCQQQEEHYEDDEEAAEAFQEHLDCLLDTDCDVLETDADVCRNDEVYIW